MLISSGLFRILVLDSDMAFLSVVMTTGIIFGLEYTAKEGNVYTQGDREKLK